MLALQLLVNGLVTGAALGLVAVSFSLIYATTKLFHVAHAGVYTLSVDGNPYAVDGTADPFRILGLTDAALDTSTKEEEVQTYDEETQGFDQSVATGKSFTMKLSGVCDFNDTAYKLIRYLEKDAVSYGTMAKLARIGPTGSTETVYGYGRFTNFSEKNQAGTIVKYDVTFKGYGAYELDF